ncbi:MAG: tetratricopeptide repeat protein [Marinilabilia sp.]
MRNLPAPIFILTLILYFSSCMSPDANNQKEEKTELHSENDIPGTDSLVVEHLIQRSIDHYGQGGVHADITDSYLSEAQELAQKNDNHDQLARINNLLGQRYRNQAQYGKAMKFHQQALDYATQAGNKNLLAQVYNQLGVVYRRVDDNPSALEMHVKALDMAEETNDSSLISSAINSIGNVNYNLGRYASSIEYFKRSLRMSDQMDNFLGLAINHNNLGESLLKLGQVDSALTHFFTSLDYNYQINSEVGQSISFNSIGGAYLEKDRPHKALEYLEKALRLNEELGDRMQVAISHSNIGETYLDIGEMEMARHHLERSIEVAREIGSLFQIEESARLLSNFYETNQNHQKALDYFKTAAIYRDSIINEKNIHHLATQEAILDSERQRERIEELNEQTLEQKSLLDRQRFILITSLILVIAISFAIIMLVRQSQLRNRYKSIRHQQRLLRSQMNPHFIFNALSAIQVYVLEHDIEKSSRFLTDFARLMRQVLRSSAHDYISLKEETQILEYYLELQRLRFSESFEYSLHIDGSLNADNIMVPPMLTQPFIENAIEHGIRAVDNDGEIKVRFRHEKSQMIVEVEDNGIGIEASKDAGEKGKNHESMAIKITRERLEMLKRDSGGQTDLYIMDKKHVNPFDRGTLVRIILPVVEINNNKKDKAAHKLTKSQKEPVISQ